LTAFLGYLHSPKLFFYSVSLYILYTVLGLIFLIASGLPLQLLGWQSSSPVGLGIKENLYINQGNTKELKYFKTNVNNNTIITKYYRNSPLSIIIKREYSISYSLNNPNISNRLNKIIKELNLDPVYIYENLNREYTKRNILKDTNNLSGIYMILNNTTKDYYIGSASTNRFYARFSNHVIYFRGSKIVKLAIKKYKLENFSFLILELYHNVVTKENNKELIYLEDKYLKLLLPNYNLLTEAGSSFGYKHTELDRQKMKDVYSQERRERIGNLNKGKKLSLETIEKIREKALTRPPMSYETKQGSIKHTRPVILYNINGTVYGEYTNIIEAAKVIDCNEKTIRRALKTEEKLVKKQLIVKDLVKN
jgi:group I intron endonuclease